MSRVLYSWNGDLSLSKGLTIIISIHIHSYKLSTKYTISACMDIILLANKDSLSYATFLKIPFNGHYRQVWLYMQNQWFLSLLFVWTLIGAFFNNSPNYKAHKVQINICDVLLIPTPKSCAHFCTCDCIALYSSVLSSINCFLFSSYFPSLFSPACDEGVRLLFIGLALFGGWLFLLSGVDLRGLLECLELCLC